MKAVVWINGPFGSGKTTLAEELRRQRPHAVVFDPEYIGYLLREALPHPVADFQDLESWREIIAAAVTSLHRHHADLPLVPMTLIQPTYRQEIFGALFAACVPLIEVFLRVDVEELRRRISVRQLFPDDLQRDADAREWCLSQVVRGVDAVGAVLPDALILDASTAPPPELARAVLDRVRASKGSR